MRAVIQRVKSASVNVGGKKKAKIKRGLLVLLGIRRSDQKKNAFVLAKKIVNLRIFADDQNKMNLSLLDIKGEILVVSQFTLYANCKKGNRPSFQEAAEKQKAKQLYQEFIKAIETFGLKPKTGEFGAMMEVSLINDGPVTIILEA